MMVQRCAPILNAILMMRNHFLMLGRSFLTMRNLLPSTSHDRFVVGKDFASVAWPYAVIGTSSLWTTTCLLIATRQPMTTSRNLHVVGRC